MPSPDERSRQFPARWAVRPVPRKLVDRREVVMLSLPDSVAAEKFRRLKTVLVNEHPDARVLAVTSPTPAEGKSVVAMNLALAFASDSSGETLLVDADLRWPAVDRWLQPRGGEGLAEVLAGTAEVDDVILDLANSRLKLLTAGTPPRDPVDLLASENARALFRSLRTRFSRVIVDTPPIVAFTDADVIGGSCDGILLVARAGKTALAAFAQAVEAVTSTRILGAVLNARTPNLADRRYSYEGYYASARGRKKGRR
jgi:protein-tyrosine kinase